MEEAIHSTSVCQHGLEVVGDVHPCSLRDLRTQVGDLHHATTGVDRSLAQLVHAEDRQDAGVERARGVDDLVGGEDRGHGVGGRGDVGGHELDPADAAAVADGDLSLHHLGVVLGCVELGLENDRLDGGGEHPADRREEAARFVERGGEVAERLRQTDQHEVAERMTFEIALAEAVLERVGPHALVAREGNQAAADVARRCHAEIASEPAR